MKAEVKFTQPQIESVDLSLSEQEARLILVLLGNTYPNGDTGDLAYNMFEVLYKSLGVKPEKVPLLDNTGYSLGKAKEFING